ncbi:hypothetical protein [Chryseobacterium sp.]|uniref:hypothetical protein n=1 Tax=Chryseobacterium sp. TaxID=1871047 RepID=UPI0031DC02F2
MKKSLTFLVLLLGKALISSQVGINKVNPQGIFNIDAAKDNTDVGIPTLWAAIK